MGAIFCINIVHGYMTWSTPAKYYHFTKRYIWPINETLTGTITPGQSVSVDQKIIIMKGYTKFHKVPGLESHHHMV